MSPWDSPVYVIHNPNPTWRMLQDIWAINACMELVGAPLRSLPWISAIPSQLYFTVIDLKDCFYSISFHEKDYENFTFSIPIVNSQPDKRYEWAILPQRMTNSPSFCQQYLFSILSPYCDKDITLLCIFVHDLIIGYLEGSGIASWVITIIDNFQQHGLK